MFMEKKNSNLIWFILNQKTVFVVWKINFAIHPLINRYYFSNKIIFGSSSLNKINAYVPQV